MKRQFLNVDTLSEYLTLSKSFIYKKVAADEIPHHKIGSKTVFDVDEINLWVRNNGKHVEAVELNFADFKGFLD